MMDQRRTSREAVLVVAVCWIVASSCSSIAMAGPVQEPDLYPGPEKAQIRGRVTLASDGAPLRGAVVTLVRPAGRRVAQSTTDEDGWYEVATTEEGLYLLLAEATGFLPSQKGADASAGGARQLSVRHGQHVGNADLTLLKAGVISGRLVDERGAPLIGVAVYAMVTERVAGADRLLTLRARSRSDDHGAFRLIGLLPDTYFVVASPAPFGIDPIPSADRPLGGVPTLFPSATDLSAATPIRVAPGQEVSTVEITLARPKVYRLDGMILDVHGNPASEIPLSLFVGHDVTSSLNAETWTRANGSFSFSLPAGTYIVQTGARTDDRVPAFASAIVDLDRDISDLVLHMREGRALSGRVLLDGKPPLTAVQDVWIIARGVDYGRSPVGLLGARVYIDEQWNLEIRPVWAPQTLHLLKAPAGWTLKRIEVGGVDYTDRPIPMDVQGGAGPIHVVLTNKVRVVGGRARDTYGRPAPFADIVVFAADSGKWEAQSPVVRKVSVAEDGRFRLPALPTGHYFVVALEDAPEHRWSRPDFLAALRSKAMSLSIDENDSTELDLLVQRQGQR